MEKSNNHSKKLETIIKKTSNPNAAVRLRWTIKKKLVPPIDFFKSFFPEKNSAVY